MKYFFLALLFFSAFGSQPPAVSRNSSHEDLEQALKDIQELKKQKPCCRLTKARVAALTTIVSTALTAAITISTMYSKCTTPEQ